ncbi:MAG: CopD family protein [Chromatiaceae bacterium]|nr:CopD family protein [Gammaproteobacteria bacterium]MCP5300150.1 CopD family protein [Chromatiaceae bacterium]MCP5422222.1 CopD family protein [Chromatiaceae bacterium]
MMGVAVLLHVLAVVIWVGGMFFAYMVLRPVAASQLEAPVRLTLWGGVFARFFPWVWAAIAVILLTGFWMIFAVFGGMGKVALYVHAMLGLGVVMMLIFFHVFFAPYGRLRRAVAANDWPAGGKALGQIRMLVGINTLIGLATIAIGAGGRYLAP